MKRSKMIEKLRDLVQESNGDFGEYDDERAEFVLRGLEKLGMIPPKTGHTHRILDAYQWEPEDEKN